MPFVPQDRVNRTQRYGYIFNIFPFNRQDPESPVADENKPVLRMGADDTSYHLMGEPPDAVVRHRPEGARINGNYHFQLPFLNYKCGD
jgi:hypothetical protein